MPMEFDPGSLSDAERTELTRLLGLQTGDIVFFQAGEPGMVNAALGNLRVRLGEQLKLIPNDENGAAKAWNFLWVTDFPLFEYDAETKRFVACHHPFTAPTEASQSSLASNPAAARARAYDLVLNGHEIGGGSIRIHTAQMQKSMFNALGFTPENAEEQFGFFIRAMEYGAPPHGGIAFGLDRLCMLIVNAESIRDVIAFPKTQKARCLLTSAPAKVSALQLRELGLRIKEHS
jgi:aspartyl-tRNA synthetase